MKTLQELLSLYPGVHVPPERASQVVTDVVADSRRVKPGAVFAALPGTQGHGRDYADEAFRRGALAVITSCEEESSGRPLMIFLKNLESVFPDILRSYYGRVDEHLKLIGITGTNGKTTVSYLLESIAQSAGLSCGVLGTVNYRWSGQERAAGNTTPGIDQLYALLATMRRAGVTHAVMEVSSHALDQDRCAGLKFSTAVWTNLTQDHLDYHQTMEHYFQSKAKLFTRHLHDRGVACVNADDEFARKLTSLCPDKRSIMFGINRDSPADITIKVRESHLQGTQGVFLTQEGEFPFSTPLIGRHNVSNIGAAAAAARALGWTWADIVRGVKRLRSVPGRLEHFVSEKGVDVFVDYAHTADALRHVLATLRPLTLGRLWVVFGCGGNRDQAKRPRMGQAADEGADEIVITNDNPRDEDPKEIAAQIQKGIRRKTPRVILDRWKAIETALDEAEPGDVVCVAGKGHETIQIIGHTQHPFDDREVVSEILSQTSPRETRL